MKAVVNRSSRTPATPRSRLTGCLALAFAAQGTLLLHVGPAHAQEAAPAAAAPSAGLEEVVVTARRTRENLQEVPTAVTSLSQKELADQKIQGFENVGQSVPNLNVQKQFGSGSAPLFSMRGQDGGSVALQVDNRIGLYIDGVYLGRSGSSAFALADLCRVEALRGPQGTLFGRNATGGAINMITCAPTGAFGGSVEVGLGNYNLRHLKASLNTQEVLGLSAKLTLLHDQHDGYVKNGTPGVVTQLSEPFGTVVSASDFGREKTTSVGAALRYKGVAGLTVDYKFDHTEKKSTQYAPQLLALNGAGSTYLYGTPNNGYTGTPTMERQGTVDANFMGTGSLQIEGHSLTAEYALTPTLTLKNIASYRRMRENTSGNDIDGASFNGNFLTNAGIPTPPDNVTCYICSAGYRTQQQFSNELQLLGSSGAFNWIAGLFYFRENGRSDAPVFIGGSFAPGVVNSVGNLSRFTPSDYFAGSDTTAQNKSTAGYGHLKYKATEDLTLALGLRQTRDERQEHLLQGPAGPQSPAQASFDYTDYDLSANYKLAANTNGYVKYGTAHLSGGIQSGLAFQPEGNRAIELGVKSDLWNKRLRLNAAVFQNKVSNQQLAVFSTSTGFQTINVGKATQRGFEFEVTAKPLSALTLSANYGYVRATSEIGLASLTPKQTLFVSSEYRFAPLGGMLPSVRLDVSWRDKQSAGACAAGFAATPTGCVSNGGTVLDVQLPARTNVGARFNLADIALGANTSGRFSLWGRNLLNSDKLQFARDLGNGTVVGSFEEPRTFGVDFTVDF
jgi:iron complex outermembrane receptor protein